MKEITKNIIIAFLFIAVLILGQIIVSLIEKNDAINLELQSQVEKSSDLEMVLEDKFISDYLRRINTKQTFGFGDSIN